MAKYINLYALEHKEERVLTNMFFAESDEMACKFICKELTDVVNDLKVDDNEEQTDKAKSMLRNSIKSFCVVKVCTINTYDVHESINNDYQLLLDLKDLFNQKNEKEGQENGEV